MEPKDNKNNKEKISSSYSNKNYSGNPNLNLKEELTIENAKYIFSLISNKEKTNIDIDSLNIALINYNLGGRDSSFLKVKLSRK